VLYKPEATKKIITPYKSLRFTFSLINPLTALSQVFKPKPYLNAGGKYNFSSPPGGRAVQHALSEGSCFATAQDTGSLYTTSSKPKGKSDDFEAPPPSVVLRRPRFKKVYSDKSANNPFEPSGCHPAKWKFIVNNFFKQYPNQDLAKANLDYKLINTILCNQPPNQPPPNYSPLSY
jgi:hypothetical protein